MIIKNDGSVVLFTPEGDFEYEWMMLNLETEGWQWLGKSLVVDHRMAQGLTDGIEDAGFVIERQ
jgi:hypothetical protein